MPQQILPQELKERLDRGDRPLLLDVRQDWESERAQIEGSVRVPLDQLAQRFREIQPADGQAVVAYCHHGMRSINAALFLEAQGLRGVYSLQGGIDAWSLQVDPRIPRY